VVLISGGAEAEGRGSPVRWCIVTPPGLIRNPISGFIAVKRKGKSVPEKIKNRNWKEGNR
jgi:hypothetical protein